MHCREVGGTRGRLPRATLSVVVAGMALMALALVLATPAGTALANGTPINIRLSYTPGISNWGPQNVTGVAELITSEGEARVTLAGLETLTDADEYQVWIRTADPSSWLRLGALNMTAGNVGRMDTVRQGGIPELAWELMQVSVEAKGTQPAAPGSRLTAAGRFSMTPGGGTPPKVLPNTGGDGPMAGVPTTGLLGLSGGGSVLLVLLVVGVVSFALGRAGARRRA
jgi:hypothetical protein